MRGRLWNSPRHEARTYGRSRPQIQSCHPSTNARNPSENAVERNSELWFDQQRHREGHVYDKSKNISFKELDKDVIITATNLTDSYFFVASKQTTPELSVIDAVVHSCCGNIVLAPTVLRSGSKTRTP